MLLFAPARRSPARFLSYLIPAAIAASFVLAANVGHASERIPGELKDELGLGCTPTCLLCHTVLTGGAEFLNPFGQSMDKAGLLAGAAGVNRVFGTDGSGWMSDFDMDGVVDAQELLDNTDPSVPGPDADPICSDVTYGCAASVAPHAPASPSGWAVGLALGVALVLWRQRRPG